MVMIIPNFYKFNWERFSSKTGSQCQVELMKKIVNIFYFHFYRTLQLMSPSKPGYKMLQWKIIFSLEKRWMKHGSVQ